MKLRLRFMRLLCILMGFGSLTFRTFAQQPPKSNSMIAWSPDGQKIAVSGSFGVRLYSSSLQFSSIQIARAGVINHIAWSPDSKKLASANSDSSVRIWDVRTGRLVTSLQGHTDEANSITWNPTGDRIATGSADGTARIWNVSTGQVTRILQTEEIESVQAVGWSPDGLKLVTMGPNPTGGDSIIIWDPNTGNQLSSIVTSIFYGPTISWNPTSKLFLVGTSYKVGLQLGQGEPANFCSTGTDFAAAWSLDGSKIALVGIEQGGQFVCVEDVATSIVKGIAILPPMPFITSVTISPTGDRIATVRGDGEVHMWNTSTGKLIVKIPEISLTRVPRGIKLRLEALCSPDPSHFRIWRITNPNSFEVKVLWTLNNDYFNDKRSENDQWGYIVIAANSEKTLQTKTVAGQNTVRVYSPGSPDLQDTKDSILDQCATLTPTPANTKAASFRRSLADSEMIDDR